MLRILLLICFLLSLSLGSYGQSYSGETILIKSSSSGVGYTPQEMYLE
ncbi:MAG: hypothetical protein ACI837_000780, partial [Crocinitomicaceae bacterium]